MSIHSLPGNCFRLSHSSGSYALTLSSVCIGALFHTKIRVGQSDEISPTSMTASRSLVLGVLLMLVLLGGCMGGDNGGGTPDSVPPTSPVIERTVYLADQDTDDVLELYLVGSSVKLNPPLPKGKNVLDFQITPDKKAVVYRADQDTDEVFELYRVEFANPGVSTKLNSPLPAGGDVWLGFITPDSSSVLYLADQTTDGVLELYRVAFATPGVSTKLNGPLVAGGNVFFDFAITPDNSAVVYRATEATANTIDLYRVPLSTPGLSTKLSGTLPTNSDVGFLFKITPDSASVVYTVDQPFIVPGVFDFRSELYQVSFATPGQSTKLNGPLGTVGGIVEAFIGQFEITPDGSAVVYTTMSFSTGDYRFLNRVPFATPGQSTKLNGSVTDRFIDRFAIRPDSSGVVYEANTDSPRNARDGTELYLVPFATPGVSTKLNGLLVTGGSVQTLFAQSFAIAPDNSSIVYIADETTNGVIDLYRVPFSTPGVSTKLNGPLVAGGFVSPSTGDFGITPDSSSVLYIASQTTAGVTELYRVPFATPGTSSKLNGPLVAGGHVENFIAQ